jgi:hypothetical protein
VETVNVVSSKLTFTQEYIRHNERAQDGNGEEQHAMHHIVVTHETNAGYTVAIDLSNPADDNDEGEGHSGPRPDVKPGHLLPDTFLDFTCGHEAHGIA